MVVVGIWVHGLSSHAAFICCFSICWLVLYYLSSTLDHVSLLFRHSYAWLVLHWIHEMSVVIQRKASPPLCG